MNTIIGSKDKKKEEKIKGMVETDNKGISTLESIEEAEEAEVEEAEVAEEEVEEAKMERTTTPMEDLDKIEGLAKTITLLSLTTTLTTESITKMIQSSLAR